MQLQPFPSRAVASHQEVSGMTGMPVKPNLNMCFYQHRWKVKPLLVAGGKGASSTKYSL